MGRRLERTVTLADPVTGVPVTYLAGDDVDDETAARITNPKAWQSDSPEESSAASEDGEPPRSGKGSGIDAWRTYAASVGVEHDDDATKQDIIDAVDAAK